MKKFSIFMITMTIMFTSLMTPVMAKETKKNLYDVMSEKAVRDDKRSKYVDFDDGIHFNYEPIYYPEEENLSIKINNGKGVYMMSSTAKDLYPIYYYRGKVDDNNVLFGGFCWKMVRTTDAGGVKIIYNGEPNEDGTCTNSIKYFDPSLNLGWGYWNVEYNGYMSPNNFEAPSFDLDDLLDFKDISWITLTEKEEKEERKISGTYYYASEVRYENGKYTLVNPTEYTFGKINDNSDYDKIYDMESKYSCLNDGVSCDELIYIIYLDYSNNGNKDNKLYYVTLQNGETKESIIENLKKQKIMIGNDVSYENGKYILRNTAQISLIEPDIGNKHYTCFTNSNSCETVAYIYEIGGELEYPGIMFFNLSKGDTIENIQAVYDVYKSMPNEKDSLIKTTLDKWYSAHMQDYTQYLEDTVWCNDRSIYYGNLDKNSVLKLYEYVGFASDQRDYPRYWGDLDFVAKPSLACSNKNDRFTVSTKNGNGKLTYPVATITSDELLYAGSTTPSGDYCLNFTELTMSMNGDGWVSYMDWDYLLRNWEEYDPLNANSEIMPTGCGGSMSVVLPVVSLKRNMAILDGNGTEQSPFTLVEVPEDQIQVPNTSDGIMNHILVFGVSLITLFIGLYISRRIRYEE